MRHVLMGGLSPAAAAEIERDAAKEAALGPLQSRFALGRGLVVPCWKQVAGVAQGVEPRCHK
jgi:hypothetical protein